MWTKIKKAGGFRRHVRAIMAQENCIIALFSAYFAVTVDNEEIFCHRDAVQATQIVFQWFSHQGVPDDVVDLVNNSFPDGGKFF